MNNFDAKPSEIAILASEDTHYSIPKGANLLLLDWLKVPLDFDTRTIDISELDQINAAAKNKGKKYFIVVSNMGTTMFGAVDNPDVYTTLLDKHQLEYKLHIDAAYGGFVYPFSNEQFEINFSNRQAFEIIVPQDGLNGVEIPDMRYFRHLNLEY